MSLNLKTVNDNLYKTFSGIQDSFFPSIYKKIKKDERWFDK